jgi:hypothetical protein
VPPARLGDLQEALPPGRLLSLNAVSVNDSPDIDAKRQNPAASLNFVLPNDWTSPGLVHLGFRAILEGGDAALPCTNCDNLDQNDQPVFLWFRDTWPILDTAYVNPDYDTTNPNWASNIVDGKTFSKQSKQIFLSALTDIPEPNPRFEWTPVFGDEIDDNLVGLSGTAVNVQLSDDDIPFTHPFGFDWEFFVASDPAYWRLLAPSNIGSGDQEYSDATANAYQRGLIPAGVGVLGVETDQDLVPAQYRVRDGDRVAVFGRWIVDAGHADFHTEIHPPFLLAFARVCTLEGVPQNDATCSLIISRPYLVSQEFGDGAVLKHMAREFLKGFGIACAWYWPPFLPCTTRFEAHPRILPKPFGGVQQVSYVVRPPRPRQSPADELLISAHFTVRPGISVRLSAAGSDAVEVNIRADATTYQPPGLPRRADVSLSEGELEAQEPDFEDAVRAIYFFGLGVAGFAQAAIFSVILGRGILTDRYEFQ